jgi:hypothetical protein
MTDDRITYRRGTRRVYLVAVLVTIAWQGIWFLTLRPVQSARTRIVPPVPVLVYAPPRAADEEGGDDLDARKVWSPVLFSLPSSIGFSRTVLNGTERMRPPLNAPSTSQLFLARPEVTVTNPWAVTRPPLSERVVRAQSPLPRQGDRIVFRERNESVRPSMTFSGDLVAQDLLESSLPGRDASSSGLSEVQVFLKVNERGDVEQVLLEETTPGAPATDRLVASLYRWRFAPGAVRYGRVQLVYSAARLVEATAEQAP